MLDQKRRNSTRRNSSQKGSNLVEGALILLTFLLLLIGIVDFGQVLYFHQVLVERARTGARYGAINPTNSDGIKNMVVYNAATVGASPSPVVGGLTTSMVAVSNTGNNSEAARVVVTISGYNIQFLSPYIAQSFTNRPIVVAATAEGQVP
jgi:Flp pilus assembly protein TadG